MGDIGDEREPVVADTDEFRTFQDLAAIWDRRSPARIAALEAQLARKDEALIVAREAIRERIAAGSALNDLDCSNGAAIFDRLTKAEHDLTAALAQLDALSTPPVESAAKEPTSIKRPRLRRFWRMRDERM